jgi:uncharacterized protein DUF932
MYNTHGQRFGGHTGSLSVRGPMSDDEIMRVAPSVFQREAHESRSARFSYIPTFEVLSGLRKEGFEVVAAVQGKSRVEGKTDFTKHLLRLQHRDHAIQGRMGGVSPECVLLNAHDGTSSYRLMSGVLRGICLNSLIVWEDGAEDLKIAHTGDVMGRVIEGSFTVLNDSQKAIERASDWQGIMLSADESMVLAESARVLRFGDSEGNVESPVQARQLLAPRRREDVGNDLWLTANRLQENVVRGGIHAVSRDAQGRRRNSTTREINGVSESVRLNRALWMLSARMAELKGVAA